MNPIYNHSGEIGEGLSVVLDSPVWWISLIRSIKEVHQLLVIWKEGNLL